MTVAEREIAWRSKDLRGLPRRRGTVAITLRVCCAAGGDPTGTGTGGESIYGRPFKDEIHSRLRFTHRGLVACANRNEPHTNGSQFFITLDATPQLDRKYTIFGRVAGEETWGSVVWERLLGRAVLLIIVNIESAHVDLSRAPGDTLYNLLRFNDVEVDADDRPEDAVTLRRADVLWNPFEDIAPRVDREAREAAAAEAAQRAAREAKEARRKGAKNLSLISFGDEAEADEEAAAAPIHIASAHDVLEDPRLKKEAAVEVDLGRCVCQGLRWLHCSKYLGSEEDAFVPRACPPALCFCLKL